VTGDAVTLAEKLGDAVRRTYRDANITQGELAKAIGVSQSTVSEWVNGRSAPSAIQIVQVDEACGRPAGYTMRRAGLLNPVTEEVAQEAQASRPQSVRPAVNVHFDDVRRLCDAILKKIGDTGPKGESPQEFALRAAWSAAAAAIAVDRPVDEEYVADVADWSWFRVQERTSHKDSWPGS
jgi:transcriptional regulator with XRE-family HTH domain